MDAGSLFARLEKLFTEPALGRTLFAFVVLCSLVYFNHEAGLLHHYDTSRHLEELQKLETLVGKDPALRSRIDSLQALTFEKIESHDRPLRQKLPVWLVGLISTLIVPVPLFHGMLPSVFGKVGVDDEGIARLAIAGTLLAFVLLWGIGGLVLLFTESLLMIVVLPAVVQLSGIYGLVVLGVFSNTSAFIDLPNESEDLSFSDVLPDRVEERWSSEDSNETCGRKVIRTVSPLSGKNTDHNQGDESQSRARSLKTMPEGPLGADGHA
jgi:hypothetical protein